MQPDAANDVQPPDALGNQDSNPEYLDQNQVCYQLHHSPKNAP